MASSINIKNKKARFEYHLEESFVAGLSLAGTEIKSIRNNKASIAEAYCVFSDGEMFVRNMFINEYENSSFYRHATRGDRKLLLNKREIKKLENWLKDKGNAVIPTKVFINDKGWAKIEISCAKGKKLFDKRQDLKDKDDKREMDRAMKK
ncbi:MAG: SsrA-binding protein [Lentimonas sp.]|jgi:SsrA-binding protein